MNCSEANYEFNQKSLRGILSKRNLKKMIKKEEGFCWKKFTINYYNRHHFPKRLKRRLLFVFALKTKII